MDTTYVTIMLVVFLVLAGLAIDIGYMYVSEEDLHHSAEIAALAGAQSIKDRILFQAQNDPGKIQAAAADTVQTVARNAAIDTVTGQHSAASLVGLDTNNGNALSEGNDITVGFWNISSRSYIPGGTPVNAMQVRTKRTAESSSVGLGSLGTFLAKITGTESFGVTPVVIAAIPAGTRANIAICSAACEPSCRYPSICSVPERRMSRAPWNPASEPPATDRYLYTSLLHPVTITNSISDMVCHEMPTQEVCGRPVYTSTGTSDQILRDIEAMMYNPKVDRSNKEFDKNGKLLGWWVMVPVLECGALQPGEQFQQRTVTRYALVRISRICVSGPAGCGASGAAADLPAVPCGAGQDGLYLDRISWVDCASSDKMLLPGLHPVLVHGSQAPVPANSSPAPPPPS
jgi:putative Flp pilus-assembly TadE/G-like protein